MLMTPLCEAAATKAEPRPNVLRLFDEARDLGLKLGVCSAATKSSAVAVVENLLGRDRYQVRPKCACRASAREQADHDQL